MSAAPSTTFLKLPTLAEEARKLAPHLKVIAEEASQRSLAILALKGYDNADITTNDSERRAYFWRIIEKFNDCSTFLHGQDALVTREEVTTAIAYIMRQLGNSTPNITTWAQITFQAPKVVADKINQVVDYLRIHGVNCWLNKELHTPEAKRYIKTLEREMWYTKDTLISQKLIDPLDFNTVALFLRSIILLRW